MKPKPTYQELENENEILRQKLKIYNSNENFHAFFDNNKAIMLQINTKTKQIINANKTAVNFYGYSKNELLQKSVSDLNTLSPDKINTIIKEVVNSKSNFFEFRHKLSNGKIKDVEVYVSPSDIDDKTHVIATIYDITKRKKAEQSLQKSKNEYKKLFENNPVSIWDEDFSEVIKLLKNLKNEEVTNYKEYFEKHPDFVIKCANSIKITNINQATLNLLKYKSKDKLINNITNVFNNKSFETFRNQLIILAQGEKQFSSETEFVCSTGEIISAIVEFKQITDFKKVIFTITDITASKKVEKALKESLENYRLLTETMKDVVVRISITGELLYVSPATEEFGGYKPEEEVGCDISKYFAEKNDYQRTVKLITEVTETHKTGNFEFMYKHKNKAPFPVEYSYMPLIKDNKVYAIQMVLRDISDRKKDEQALKKSEEKLRSIIKSMDDIVFMLDKENRFVSVNAINENLFLKPEMFLGKKHSEVISKHIDDLYNAAMINVKKGKTEEYEYSLNMPNEIRWYALKLSPIFNNGKFDGTVSVVRDITDRKKSEQIIIKNNKELQILNKKVIKNEQRLKTIIENQGEGFGIMNIDEEFVFTNPAACEIFNLPNGQLTNRNLKEFVEEKEWSKILQQTAKRKLNETSTYELTISLADNIKKYLMVTASPDYDANNNITGTIGVFRDITDRKKTEQALKESEAKLRESNATKDTFFSIIAHDLKSPFNAILGFSQILLKNHKIYDDKKREKIIKSVNDSANSAYKLVENLLTWARSQAGKITYTFEKLHLKTLVTEMIYELQEVANQKEIQLTETISDDEMVFADKNMIATILRNLISNAIKFTNNGGNILISFKKQKDSNFVEISVADTGVGISKNKIDNLFRIDKNTTTKGTENEAGTGLGLILCKEFTEKHGCEIWAESERGKGSKFIFSMHCNYESMNNINKTSKNQT